MADEASVSEKRYVWVVWVTVSCRRPSVERYTLVRRNPSGGVTVCLRGSNRVIKPMAGKKFFFDEVEFVDWYRRWMAATTAAARSRLADLEADLARPDLGMSVEVQPDVPPGPFPWPLKLE